MQLRGNLGRRWRKDLLLSTIQPHERILEIGCGSGWVKDFLLERNCRNYTGLDLFPPANIVGDLLDWRELGLQPESFDVIVAFEIAEHVPCFEACHQLLKPDGRLFVTTPVPQFDWVMKILEAIGVNQKRTSPHSHLINLEDVAGFRITRLRKPFGIAQWAEMRKV
jgi:cyclopropane fatty-acyl-phospholipid synthase-like methyltransferase